MNVTFCRHSSPIDEKPPLPPPLPHLFLKVARKGPISCLLTTGICEGCLTMVFLRASGAVRKRPRLLRMSPPPSLRLLSLDSISSKTPSFFGSEEGTTPLGPEIFSYGPRGWQLGFVHTSQKKRNPSSRRKSSTFPKIMLLDALEPEHPLKRERALSDAYPPLIRPC